MKKSPLKRRGRERGTPLPAYRAWIRTAPCVALPSIAAYDADQCRGAVQAAHLPRVKQHGDAQNLVPLCRAHHMEQHRIGVRSFAEKYGLNLQVLADWYWECYEGES